MALCVMFDLDGTLIDSRAAILSAYRYALEPVVGGFARLESLGFGHVMRIRMVDVMTEVAGRLAGDCAVRYDDFYHREAHRHVRIYPGAVDLLTDLRDLGLPLGIVTNKGRSRTATDLDGLDGEGTGRQLFAVIISTEDTALPKPSPQPILLALERTAWPAADTVYVGDGPHDLEAAQAAGTTFIGAGWGYYGEQALADAPTKHPIEIATDVPDLHKRLVHRMRQAT